MATALRPTEFVKAGVDFPAGGSTVYLDGVQSSLDYRNTVPLFELTSAGTLVPNQDYTWNTATGQWTLLNGATFVTGVNYVVSFQPQDFIIAGDTQFGSGSFVQYPHTLKYKVIDQSGATTVVTSVEKKCRIEYNQKALAGVANNDDTIYIGIIYAPLPLTEIPKGTTVNIFEGVKLISTNVVKQFRKGAFNVRIWV